MKLPAQPRGPPPDEPAQLRRRRRRRLLSNSQMTTASHLHSHFPVHRLDDLFAATWGDERLGFAHFDLEGFELSLSVLHGARRTIERDRPIFTADIFVHNRPRLTVAVLRFLRDTTLTFSRVSPNQQRTAVPSVLSGAAATRQWRASFLAAPSSLGTGQSSTGGSLK